MSEIDWSKAPEGATHAGFVGDDIQFYRIPSILGGDYDFFSLMAKVWRKSSGDPMSIQRIPRPSPAWSGEGLPPVGAAVDCKCTAKTKARDWFPAEVKYISPYTVVLVDYSTEELDGEFVAHPATLLFQPRRTPEQIAADEREAELNRMVATVGMLDKGWARKVCAGLYDAGYRKP